MVADSMGEEGGAGAYWPMEWNVYLSIYFFIDSFGSNRNSSFPNRPFRPESLSRHQNNPPETCPRASRILSMKKHALLFSLFGGICCMVAVSANLLADEAKTFRPPAVPLVVHDPYFSIWSPADKLTDDWPRHWTGAINAMCSMVRIDGKPYRIMGPQPADVPAMEQNSSVGVADAHDLHVRGRLAWN